MRQIAGGYVSDDFEITPNLVNTWLNDGLAVAAKQNYIESIKLDGVAYVNNGFYTTFSDIPITADPVNNLGYKLTLPQIPVGLGKNEGISTLRFKGDDGYISQSVIWLSANQVGYADQMRPIPNKICAYNEGKTVRFSSTLPMYDYLGEVSMISGGDSTNLDSDLNLPDDWLPVVNDYVLKMLMLQKAQPQDAANDGVFKP